MTFPLRAKIREDKKRWDKRREDKSREDGGYRREDKTRQDKRGWRREAGIIEYRSEDLKNLKTSLQKNYDYNNSLRNDNDSNSSKTRKKI